MTLKKNNLKLAVIIPTVNEELNISILINKIARELAGRDFIMLIVDDNSKDGTVRIVKQLQKAYSNLYLLQRGDRLGIASAYIEGFKYCADLGYKAFIQMDADASHNPQYLGLIADKLLNNDVVIASRNIKGAEALDWSLARRFLTNLGSLYARVILDCPIKDLTGSYTGWRLDILNRIGLNNIISKGFCFQIEMKYRAYKNRAQILEFPITFQDRKMGKSKLSKRIILEALLNVIKIRFMV